jgi:transcriptional regulator with XRE-family HTH domain
MISELGRYCQDARLAHGWSLGDMARALGYQNINKGSRRVQQLESGVVDSQFLLKVISIFGLAIAEVQRRIDEDTRREREEFNKWADSPTEIEVLVDVMSGIMARRSLEGARTQSEMFEQARKVSREFGDRRTYLVVSHRLTFVFRNGEVVGWKEAKPNASTLPVTIIGGKTCQITLGPPNG